MNIDITKTYTTRSGLPVRIYATDGADIMVHGAYKTEFGWEYTGWTEDGSYYEDGETNGRDLIPVKTWRAWKKGGNIPTWIIAKSKRDATCVRALRTVCGLRLDP
jgi:hypothetical protein